MSGATNKLIYESDLRIRFQQKQNRTENKTIYLSDRRIRERTLEKLWLKNSGAMESFIMTLEVNNF